MLSIMVAIVGGVGCEIGRDEVAYDGPENRNTDSRFNLLDDVPLTEGKHIERQEWM